jgi:tRNA modification GTPase
MNGVHFNLNDTAGLREQARIDAIESEGIRRARQSAEQADCILWIYDASEKEPKTKPPFSDTPYIAVANKCDLHNARTKTASIWEKDGITHIQLSARTGTGIDLLRETLKTRFGLKPDKQSKINQKPVLDVFSARSRHLRSLEHCTELLVKAENLYNNNAGAELIAEELRLAQNHINEITGESGNEALLSQIFSQFCIGK